MRMDNLLNPCMPGNSLYVMASRGCPFSCSYCLNEFINNVNKANNNKIIRKRSNKLLISELNEIISNEPSINTIFFFDDDFFIRTIDELRDFAQEYKRKINLPFSIFANPNSATKTKIDICYNAGLRNIEYGLQTISKQTLSKYNRNDASKKVIESLSYIRDNKYDIEVSIDFITNSPFETEYDITKNIFYIQDLPGDFTVYVHNLHLFPGSKLRDDFECGTGNEAKEYQNNIIAGKLYNEYFTKLLMAMQGKHEEAKPEIFGTLTKKDILLFMKSKDSHYEENIRILNKKIKDTEVAIYYTSQ
jgi:radical SAM superfamily enzyme YgiQ (UPF0313 family)